MSLACLPLHCLAFAMLVYNQLTMELGNTACTVGTTTPMLEGGVPKPPPHSTILEGYPPGCHPYS